jgi:signal transduction histidine kinase
MDASPHHIPSCGNSHVWLLGLPGSWPVSLQTTLTILLSSSAPMCLGWGPDLKFFFNDAYASLSDRQGKSRPVFGQPAGVAMPEWEKKLRTILNGGKVTEPDSSLDATYQYCCIPNDEGIPYGVLVTCMDGSAMVQHEREQEYMAIASHELKNPLTSLKISLDLLSNQLTDPTNLSLVEKGKEQVRRLVNLASDLLNVSRIAAGELDITPGVFNIDTCIRESIASVEGTLGPGQFLISGPTDMVIPGDLYRIEQVLVNLLSNAVKYSPKRSPVGITIISEASRVKILVNDRGVGIDAAKFPLLFQKFARLEPYTVDGHGLGLYISQQIIRKHGGEMGVESELGKGSTFWFVLPR